MQNGLRRVLLKVSGELLSGDLGFGLDHRVMRWVCEDIVSVVRGGTQVCLVIGGGNIFRGSQCDGVGLGRSNADKVGMLATVMNAIVLQDILRGMGVAAHAMSGVAVSGVCRSFVQDEAMGILDSGGIPVFGGGIGSPFFTTDTTAVLRALEMRCDGLFKGTHVDGVYSSDPLSDPDAIRYDELTYDQVLRNNLKVMDGAAIAMAREHSMPLTIFSLQNPGSFTGVLRGDVHATRVVP